MLLRLFCSFVKATMSSRDHNQYLNHENPHFLTDEGNSHNSVYGSSGGGDVGSMLWSTSNNNLGFSGDIYDVVGSSSKGFNPLNSSSGQILSATRVVPFTAAQWQELERQTMIYKYLISCIPVPPELLIPMITNTTVSSSNTHQISNPIVVSTIGKLDPEPWRCKRTDGKKWRCSRDVVPEQKYCERHSHKTRPRSRKPVEIKVDEYSAKRLNFSGNYNNDATASEPPRCLEWFMTGENTQAGEWNQGAIGNDGLYKMGCLGGETTEIRETRRLIDGIDHNKEARESNERNHSMSSNEWLMSGTSGSWAPGGPLAEALCLGIATSSSNNNSRCSNMEDGGGDQR